MHMYNPYIYKGLWSHAWRRLYLIWMTVKVSSNIQSILTCSSNLDAFQYRKLSQSVFQLHSGSESDMFQTNMELIRHVSNKYTNTDLFSESYSIKRNLDSNYTFPIYLTPNRILYGAKSVKKL